MLIQIKKKIRTKSGAKRNKKKIKILPNTSIQSLFKLSIR